MKALAYAGFALLAAAFAGILVLAIYATVNDTNQDPPEVAARKAHCKEVEAHLFAIAGSDPQKIDQLVAGVPIEDIEQCAAADKDKQSGQDRKPAAVACMLEAHDDAALRKCIPPKQE